MKPSYEELEVMLQNALDKIKASQEQEPVYQVWKYKDPCSEYRQWCDCSETEYNEASHTKRKLYEAPVIPPELAELQRQVEFWKNSSQEWKLAYVALGGTASESGKEELRKLLESKVPEGWQLVPKEPTDDMIDSGYTATEQLQSYAAAKTVYYAMLNAAPQPKEPKQ